MKQSWCRPALAWVAVFLILCVTSGCGPTSSDAREPDQIKVISEDPQYGVVGVNDVKQVSVEVLTVAIPGMLGGKGSRRPAAGQRLLLRAVDEKSGLRPAVTEGITDSGGRLVFEVTLGANFGDQYLEVSCASRPTVKRRLRFVSGVQIENNKQEVVAGESLANPLRVSLFDATAAPLSNVPVYFSIIAQPGKRGTVTPTLCLTDENGAAEVELQTEARATGVYLVNADIANPSQGQSARPLTLEADAIHVPGLVIGVLGGLAIFVFGMTLMSDGLQQVAGNRMKKVMAIITGNRVRAILAGAAVAGLIQSSAATVMTVGFVNAGLLTLKQAIGVIFGSNIGTTATGQMVSFNLSGMALPALTIGMVLLFILRGPTGRGFARLVFGFGLLFFGMQMMSTQLQDVSGFPSFVRFFQLIDCQPAVEGGQMSMALIGKAIGIGIVSTIVVQSSAATIGLSIALANSGLLNIWTAVPIALGNNVGTTLTAILVSLNANRAAKQTALAHALFNILGSAVVVGLFFVHYDGVPCFFYAVNKITSGDVFAGENVGRHIAAAHSVFNILTVLIFTPFIGVFVWLCTIMIPVRAETASVSLVGLDRSWLVTPSLALDGVIRATALITEKAYWVASEAFDCYRFDRLKQVEEIRRAEAETDEMQKQIMDYLMQLTRRRLSLNQSRAVPAIMHCISDAERIADIGVLICELITDDTKVGVLTTAAQRELDEIINKTRQLADCVLKGLQGFNPGIIENAIRLEGQVRVLFKQAEQGHIERLQTGECSIERGIVYVEVLALIESIVRHFGNIATRINTITADTN